MLTALGEVAEWSIAAVLKTVELSRAPGVRIPPSPPSLVPTGYYVTLLEKSPYDKDHDC